ncbi:MAG: dCTP deaminase domain-containing protein [Alphaproteobacteria bacterium]
MILTDREISIALDTGQLVIDPRPKVDDALTSTAIDLTLDENGLEWIPIEGGFQIRPGHKDYKYSKASRFQKPVKVTDYRIGPRSFLLGWTKERIQLPVRARLAARVEGKSSLARLGIGIHITAPTIHAGFGDPAPSPIQLEIFNFGPHDIILDAGMKICQLIIEQTFGTPLKGYVGQFLGQTSGSTLTPVSRAWPFR